MGRRLMQTTRSKWVDARTPHRRQLRQFLTLNFAFLSEVRISANDDNRDIL